MKSELPAPRMLDLLLLAVFSLMCKIFLSRRVAVMCIYSRILSNSGSCLINSRILNVVTFIYFFEGLLHMVLFWIVWEVLLKITGNLFRKVSMISKFFWSTYSYRTRPLLLASRFISGIINIFDRIMSMICIKLFLKPKCVWGLLNCTHLWICGRCLWNRPSSQVAKLQCSRVFSWNEVKSNVSTARRRRS